ncbi:hypothetical protein PRIPAC_79215, partial [Pristionchus pacificus]
PSFPFTSFQPAMRTLLTLSVLTVCVVSLFRSTSYSYSYGSPYYSSSNYYYSDNYYSTPYRSNSRYSSDNYKSYTYMDGSSRPTVSKDQLASAARNQADSARVIQSSSSFTAGKLRYYWGSQYMPSQDCGTTDGKRNKRQINSYPYTTPVIPRIESTVPSQSETGVKGSGTITSFPPPAPSQSVKGSTTYPSPPSVRGSGSPSYPPPPSTPPYGRSSLPSSFTGTYTGGDVYSNVSYHTNNNGDNGNFSDYKDTLAYMNMFYVNFTDPAESLNYVETYLPDNFTSKNYSNSSTMMKDAMSNLPLNVSDRATQLAQTMMNGNVDKSINDWYNDLKDEQTYNDMIGNTNESGPVETFVGCSKNAARAICTRSISDLDSSLYSYIFNSAVPNEIAWQCPDKDYYCCEWECCKEKKWSVAGIIFCVIFALLAFSCCICCCCLCIKGKEKEKETLVVMYPKPQPQAYFISVPPRVYY